MTIPLSCHDNEFTSKLEIALAKFNPNMPVILFVEPYGAIISLLKHGLDRGFNIVILTANSDLRIIPEAVMHLASLCLHVNSADNNQVMQLMEQIKHLIKFDAVIPGFEYFVPVAANLADLLGLPGISVNNVELFRNKYLMRTQLQVHGINMPKFALCYSIEELQAALEIIGYPAVCKPVDAAGSVHVCTVTSIEEAKLAAAQILDKDNILWGYSLSKALLVEEYISGKEYSVEGVISGGMVTCFSITEKFVADEIEFIEIGHIVNPALDIQIKTRIFEYVNQVISALKPDNCPFHAELRISNAGEPVLMEIAARLAGDKIGDLINLCCDTNYFDAVYNAYLGVHEPSNVHSQLSAGIRFFYRPKTSEYSMLRGLEDIRTMHPHDIVIYYGPNKTIPEFPRPLRRLGHVMLTHNNYADLVKNLEYCDQSIFFQ